MTRFHFPPLAVLLCAAAGVAQLPPVSISIDPALEPKPALRYELLPTARERVSGNAALHYAKAALARPTVDKARVPEEEKKLAAWDDAPLDKLPVADVKAHLKEYAASLRELEHGTRCKTCEWDAAPTSGPAALDQTIAAQPVYRDLARLLLLRAKVELAERRYDAAVASIRTGLQFGKHVGEGPTLIQLLVGYAITNTFLKRAEELIACPGSPNLYWPLAALPRPLIDPRPGLDGEDLLNESFLPGLAELRKGPVANDKALDAAEAAVKLLTAATGDNSLMALGGRVAISGHAALHHESAKKELTARGWDANTVKAMPAVQAVYLNAFEAYRELADDHRKWFLTPLPEAFDGLAKASARVKKAQKDREGETLFQTFLLVLPAVEKLHHAGARTERRLAALRALEAVRVHAANAAELPKALADIKKVPVPADPLTDRPFAFVVTPDGFTLRSPESDSVPKALGLSFEVKVRK
jgi:hypothetical protein